MTILINLQLIIILLASLSAYPANASNSELDSGFSNQHRLFNKLANNWAIEAETQDETPFDESEDKVEPALRFLDEFLRSRQRYVH